MRSDLVLSTRIGSIIWEALAENDLHMLLSARERLAAELVVLVRDQQAEAWEEGATSAWPEMTKHLATHLNNPYRQEQDR